MVDVSLLSNKQTNYSHESYIIKFTPRSFVKLFTRYFRKNKIPTPLLYKWKTLYKRCIVVTISEIHTPF